jgi:Leucine-rich repeat (LRR) protein
MLNERELRTAPTFKSLKEAQKSPNEVYKLILRPSKGPGIKELAAEMQQFKNLQSLDLRNSNWVRELPEWLGDFPNLQVLMLSEMSFKELPASIAKLTNLHTLDLGFNMDLVRGMEHVYKLTNLKKLTLDCNVPLSDDFKNLVNLEDLMINGVDNTENIEAVYNLPNLKKLEILGKELTILKSGISKLKKLVSLNLTVVHVNDLPEDIIYLPLLKEFGYIGLYSFYIDNYNNPDYKPNVNWSKIFEKLSNIKTLQSINLSDNSIQKYDANIGLLSQVKKMNLYDMARKASVDPYPKEFQKLKNLIEITISDRDLEWETIKNLPKTMPFTKIIKK